MLLPCIECGKVNVRLICNKCQSCDPRPHKARNDALEASDRLAGNYERATGKRPLDNWLEYEDWIRLNCSRNEDMFQATRKAVMLVEYVKAAFDD